VRLLVPVALALALAVAAGPDAGAAPSPEVRARVEDLLGALHGPVAPETFRALGPGAEEALAEIARSQTMPSKRIRALEALASLGGARAAEAHRAVAASRAPSAVRRGAVRGLGRLAGQAGAPSALAPYLERDGDPAVRAAAAEALAEVAPEESCGTIRARARAERARDRDRFGRALARCEGSGGGSPSPR
jgi:HEAT repeat protein